MLYLPVGEHPVADKRVLGGYLADGARMPALVAHRSVLQHAKHRSFASPGVARCLEKTACCCPQPGQWPSPAKIRPLTRSKVWRRSASSARSLMAGLAFSPQVAAAVAALGLVQSYLARGERLLESLRGVGPLSARLAPVEPANLMAAG